MSKGGKRRNKLQFGGRLHVGSRVIPYYWDRVSQAMRYPGAFGLRAAQNRNARRHGARAIKRNQADRAAADNYIDRLIELERQVESEGTGERVGDKFRIFDKDADE